MHSSLRHFVSTNAKLTMSVVNAFYLHCLFCSLFITQHSYKILGVLPFARDSYVPAKSIYSRVPQAGLKRPASPPGH